jgi:hypothetical protein
VQDFFGAIDDDFSACFTDVFYAFKENFSAAWSDAVYALNACCDECCRNTVEAGGYGY